MNKESIKERLSSILQDKNIKKINYQGVNLYLVDKKILDKILELELMVRAYNEEHGIKKRNHFFEYAKIINPEYPAFKYTLLMKHKKKEIFDPMKVKKYLPAEFEIWKNKARLDLKKKIENPDSAITPDQAKKLKEKLELEIEIAKSRIDEVLENFDSYDVVISTFEHYTYYPALYYVMEVKDKNVPKDTHLRQDVPNILWFRDNRPFRELRSNDRISRVIQTFDRYCDSIYIKKKE
jgi:hypothetical protein